MELGVPLIPDRAAVRSITPEHPADAPGGRRLLTGGGALVMIVLVAAGLSDVAPIAGAVGVALLVPAAVIDVEQRRLPDAWVAAAAVALIATLALDSVVGAAKEADVLAQVALGALAMAAPVLALHLASPAAMGFGDVKATLVLGGAIGTVDPRLGVVALCLAAASGAVAGLTMRRRSIAFGPHLVLASSVVLVAHEPIATAIFAGGAPS
jgi:leader peptidase (prepilin peptidase)/N-methyltransferase